MVVILRVLVVATVVGLFLAFVGAFGLQSEPLLRRLPDVLPFSWIGGLLGFLCYRLVARATWTASRPWLATVAAALLMTLPMSVVVWLTYRLFSPPGIPWDQLPQVLTITLVMCLVFMSMATFMRRRERVIVLTAAQPTPPKFLERLPLKLRGAEVWAVEAEDHYLRLHTSKGQDLVLMRLSDAIAELEGIEGAQVHRSWWVAREAITEAVRGDGRATLTLQDGAEVPVSRTYARLLRERGWI
jgi:DNA-binding LytR/AlgR family response regulator